MWAVGASFLSLPAASRRGKKPRDTGVHSLVPGVPGCRAEVTLAQHPEAVLLPLVVPLSPFLGATTPIIVVPLFACGLGPQLG